MEVVEKYLKENYGLVRLKDSEKYYKYNTYITYKNQENQYFARFSYTIANSKNNFVVEMLLDGVPKLGKIGVIKGKDSLLYGDIIEIDLNEFIN